MYWLLLVLEAVIFLVWFNSLASPSKKKVQANHEVGRKKKSRPGALKNAAMISSLVILALVYRGPFLWLLCIALVMIAWLLITTAGENIFTQWRWKCQNIYIHSASSRQWALVQSKAAYYSPLLAIPLAIVVLIWIF